MTDIERHPSLEEEKYKVDHFEHAETVPATECTVPEPSRRFTPEEERKLYRKVDLRVMPILSVLYLMAFMDRGNIGNARLEGLEKELKMNSQQFNTTLSCFFITYCLCEVPANFIMKKFRRPSRWLGLVTTTWAIVMTLMGVVQSYGGLLAARLALGVAEAGLFPGVIFYLSVWYPRHRSQSRVAVFFGAATLAGAFSSTASLLAYGIGFMGGLGGYAGWRWIFILEGLATFVIGVASFWIIADFPADCKWLTEEEKEWLIYQKAIDSGAHGETSTVSVRYIKQALCDWQTYLSIWYYMGVNVPVYAIALISPSMIASFGHFTRPQVQLLTVPVYAVACCFVVFNAIMADRQKTRFKWIMIDMVLIFIGLIINLTPAPYGVKYMGLFFIASGAYAGLPTAVTWFTNNLSGQTKRALGSAFQIGIGNLGALASSNVYRSQDAPRYFLGHGVMLAFNVGGLIAAPLYAYLLRRANQRKLAELQSGREYTADEIRELGDKAPSFVYTI